MSYQDDLQAAQFAVEDKIGQVMSSGSAILAVRSRAQGYLASSNPSVASQAQAVVSKANGLVANLNSIQADSVSLMKMSNDLLTKMQTDPTWQAILSGNTANFGWGTMAVVNTYIANALSVTKQTYALAARAEDHLSAVGQLQDDEASLEDFASGRSVRAVASNFGSGALSFGTGYLSFAKYAAIGVGLFFVWDLAKPFLPRGKKA